ncbi:hypothetical protein KIN20_020489 [Parelaphostrongylus tenuis]|uniref:C-type lectin domain-containing protein n=1 Tax=Parelaphostrongylus tenuis TaxID=148309 RepID=A0AAD5QQW8_PARTN|nr:hypothetical protein KIN20_020489 [Parelaphostrongylus tenuis]
MQLQPLWLPGQLANTAYVKIQLQPLSPRRHLPSAARYPDGWTEFRESCYFVENRKMSMMDAERSCGEKGGGLVVASTIEEFVNDSIQSNELKVEE